MSGTTLSIGCDLGGTNVRIAVIDARGTIVRVVRRALDDRTPSVVADEIALGAKELLEEEGTTLDHLRGIGVAVAGQVLGESGVVFVGPNLGWRDVRFGALIARALGRPARIMNDLSAAVWGEGAVGAARGARHVLLVFVGSGVGSGMILDGRLYEGAGGIAGEFGHIKVIPNGRRCGCGQYGCLEAYVGGHNLAARLRELAEQGKIPGILEAAGGDPEQLGGAALERAADAGDAMAIELREEASRLLGVAMGNLVTQLNPQKLILGGGVLSGMPELRRRTVDWLRDTGGRAHVERLSVLETALGDDAGLIGAGLLGLEAPS